MSRERPEAIPGLGRPGIQSDRTFSSCGRGLNQDLSRFPYILSPALLPRRAPAFRGDRQLPSPLLGGLLLFWAQIGLPVGLPHMSADRAALVISDHDGTAVIPMDMPPCPPCKRCKRPGRQQAETTKGAMGGLPGSNVEMSLPQRGTQNGILNKGCLSR